eukprot:TRINITY_DN74331_c0_g1_i1.p1 TRINITY_DN74331_c0_g1~~TRINITY_DN74331_c0_g1_i1.p1  ORF type:complete len:623 (-),score=139.54 TRINITY_DN74331_c0_g1_i1:411-2279(-)
MADAAAGRFATGQSVALHSSAFCHGPRCSTVGAPHPGNAPAAASSSSALSQRRSPLPQHVSCSANEGAAVPTAAQMLGAALAVGALYSTRQQKTRAGRSSGKQRRSRHRWLQVNSAVVCRATGTDASPTWLRTLNHNGHNCRLARWQLPEQQAAVESCLECLENMDCSALDSGQQFWRRRTLMAARQKLEVAAGFGADGERGDGMRSSLDGGGGAAPTPGKSTPQLRFYTLHSVGDDESEPGEDTLESCVSTLLALTVAAPRDFPLGNTEALHMDQFLTQPDDAGQSYWCAAALVAALAQEAAQEKLTLTTEPQSEELEAYWQKLGFSAAEAVDPYAWFFKVKIEKKPSWDDGHDPSAEFGKGMWGGPSAADETVTELRWSVESQKHMDRLLIAFKRNPLWLGSSEEGFFALRGDEAALTLLGIQVVRLEAGTQKSSAYATIYRRPRVGTPYEPGMTTEVTVVEAMGVLRDPNLLSDVDWEILEEVQDIAYDTAGIVSTGYWLCGRCSLRRRAYPLRPASGVELVIESLELPMRSDPYVSVVVKTPRLELADTVEAVEGLFDKYRVRALAVKIYPAWNLEIVQSEGLSAANLWMDEEEDDDDEAEEIARAAMRATQSYYDPA